MEFDHVYAKKAKLQILKDQIDDVVRREEFLILQSDAKENQKLLDRLITKDECIDRLNILNESLNDKFNERPTKEYVKNNLNRYEDEFS